MKSEQNPVIKDPVWQVVSKHSDEDVVRAAHASTAHYLQGWITVLQVLQYFLIWEVVKRAEEDTSEGVIGRRGVNVKVHVCVTDLYGRDSKVRLGSFRGLNTNGEGVVGWVDSHLVSRCRWLVGQ